MSQYRLIARTIVVVLFFATMLSLPGLTFGASAPANWNTAVDAGFPQDLFERSWGTRPDKFPNSKYMADLDKTLAVYTTDIDMSPLLGTIPGYSKPRLIFSQEEGLVQVRINFDAKEYNQVQKHLKRLLGEPHPIIYERMVAEAPFEERTEWLVGPNTKVVLVSRLLGASIELSKREFVLQQEASFEELFADSLLKQASEYVRRERILEASSIYQELLNSTQYYHSFTPTAHGRLAEYSQHKDVVDYLVEDDGLIFSLLKNVFSHANGQRWLRIDFDAVAREKLKRQRPHDVKQQEDLAHLSSVLCRVQIDAVDGKYIVVEQIWLDDSNQIIGDRLAWLSQGTGYPGSFIKQTCEEFLEKWFSFGTSDERPR